MVLTCQVDAVSISALTFHSSTILEGSQSKSKLLYVASVFLALAFHNSTIYLRDHKVNPDRCMWHLELYYMCVSD
jgi:hypothetical protein